MLSLDHDEHSSFDILSESECLWLLGHTFLGRIGVTMGALPAIFPVNYAMADGAIFFRTEKGTKLSAAIRGACVAFQIDAFDLRYHHGWSVLAVGLATEVQEPELSELLEVLPLQPWAPGPRDHLVRIVPEFISGRRIGWPHEMPGSWAPSVDA